MFRRSALEMRVIILAPIGRDAALLASTLAASEIDSAIATDVNALLALLAEGAGGAIVADEALPRCAIKALATWVSELPPWSDPPFIVLTSSGIPTRETHQRAQELQALGNLTLIERPVRPDTIGLAARSALRARMRQYEVRNRQEALIQANADLEQFAHAASHDLREPLRTIGISSDLLAREYADHFDERAGELLRLIRGGVARLDTLLTDLLSYAHASSITEEELPPVPALRSVEVAMENLRCSDSGKRGKASRSASCRRSGFVKAISRRSFKTSWEMPSNTGAMTKLRPSSAGKKSGQLLVFYGIGQRHWDTHSLSGGEFRNLQAATYPRQVFRQRYGAGDLQRIIERYRGNIWVESEPGQGSRFARSESG